MSDFKGLFFTLKKRMQQLQENDRDYYKYQMLGYYDGLDINGIEKWYEFRPRGLMQRSQQVALKDPFIDLYTIRAIVPENYEELEQKGFSYSYWNRVGSQNVREFEATNQDFRKLYPFITMSVVNLSENYVKSCRDLSDMQNGIIGTILDAFPDKKDMEQLHCAVYPSIGYSDFVILSLTDSLKRSSKIIEILRGARKETNHLVSNCYSVCGLDKEYFVDTPADEQDTWVTIRINLNEGISQSDFYIALTQELEKREQEEAKSEKREMFRKLLSEIKDSYYLTFGNSDCLILPEQSLSIYLKLHAPNEVLNPETSFFKRYISSVRTSIRVRKIQIESGQVSECSANRNLGKYYEDFIQFSEQYEDFLRKNDMQIRSSKALQQIMKNFLNIAHFGHCFDVEHVLGKAFSTLISDTMYFINKEIPKLLEDDNSDQQGEKEYAAHYIQMQKKTAVEAVTLFKDHIGILIADLLRSDRPFIEGNTLTHPSIGSATKLIFAYESLLEKVVSYFGVSEKFTFVVTSGGCDRTQAMDLFSFSNPDDGIRKLILIKIPEMSLYDIQGTLFRLLHECMHFTGERMRKERFTHLVSALGYEITENISELAFQENHDWEFSFLPDEEQKMLYDEIVKINENQKDLFIHSATELFRVNISFQNYFSEVEEMEDLFYSEVIRNGILSEESLLEIFSINKFGQVDFLSQMYDLLYQGSKIQVKYILKYLDERMKELKSVAGSDSTVAKLYSIRCLFDTLRLKYEFQDKQCGYKDLILEKNIHHYADALINANSLDRTDEDVYVKYLYRDIRDAILNAMIEGFADCGAISCLDLKMEDYLLSFIYEYWNIDGALPLTVDNILRVGAVFKVKYKMERSLSEEDCIHVLNKIELRKQQGYEYHNEKEMLERVNQILAIYQYPEYAFIRTEIENYLTECVIKGSWDIPEIKELYKISELRNNADIYSAIDKMLKQWKDLCE